MNLILVTKHTCILVVIEKNLSEDSALSRFEEVQINQNLFINVTKIAHIMLHIIKIFLFNIRKVVTLLQAKLKQNLKMYTQPFLMEHPLSQHILKQISAMDMLSHKNHLFTVNLKSTGFLENKIGLVLATKWTDCCKT